MSTFYCQLENWSHMQAEFEYEKDDDQTEPSKWQKVMNTKIDTA